MLLEEIHCPYALREFKTKQIIHALLQGEFINIYSILDDDVKNAEQICRCYGVGKSRMLEDLQRYFQTRAKVLFIDMKAFQEQAGYQSFLTHAQEVLEIETPLNSFSALIEYLLASTQNYYILIDNFEYFFKHGDAQFIEEFFTKMNYLKNAKVNNHHHNIALLVATNLKHSLYLLQDGSRASKLTLDTTHHLCAISDEDLAKEIARRTEGVAFLKPDELDSFRYSLHDKNAFYALLERVMREASPDVYLPELIAQKQKELYSECKRRLDLNTDSIIVRFFKKIPLYIRVKRSKEGFELELELKRDK